MSRQTFKSHKALSAPRSVATSSAFAATSAKATLAKFSSRVAVTLGCVGLLLESTGCSSGQRFGLQDASVAFSQQVTYAKSVDILWVIDSSGSMAPRQAMLAAQVPDFMTTLNSTGLDYQMAVTTMDMSASGEQGKFLAASGTPAILNSSTPNVGSILAARLQAGANGSPIERGEESMQYALNKSLTVSNNSGFMRSNSLLVVIFLSDEDDSSPTADYKAYLDSVRPPLATGEHSWISNFMGIMPNDPLCTTSMWNYTDPGTKYIALATASGGTSESICSGDLRQALTNVRARILEVITEYHLDREPNVSTIQVTVNGVAVPNNSVNGWTYDATKLAVIFHGTAIPAPNAAILVNFTPLGEK